VGTFAVTAIGKDRPGIVAGISEALLAVGGNIEDSRMAILRGHFAVMLIVSVPAEHDAGEVRDGLAAVRDGLELEALTVAEVDELAAARASAPSHVLTVYGADHPGIVHAVSSALAEQGVNICDLQTQVAGTGEREIYVMLIEVALGDAGPAEVGAALERVGQEAGVEVSMRELEAEAL
jgi:glycine cleavage system transcriptional repressor